MTTVAAVFGGSVTRRAKEPSSIFHSTLSGPRIVRCVAFAHDSPSPGTGEMVKEAPPGASSSGLIPADHAPHPLAHGTDGVVVEGVHARVLEAASLHPSVPSLPHRRAPVLHHVDPGGHFATIEETIGLFGVAPSDELSHHGHRADDAGREAPLVGLQRRHHARGRLPAQRDGQELEVERHGVARLRVALDPAVLRRRTRSTNAARMRRARAAYVFSSSFAAQDPRHLREGLRGQREERRCNRSPWEPLHPCGGDRECR